MALPAVAAVLRASNFPNVAFKVASAFELASAIIALAGANATALDVELKAFTDAEGRIPFVDGNAITEAELLAIVKAVPQHGDVYALIVNRYFYSVAA